MKGTLISSDYVKARDNSIRLIETNTDTVIYDDILDNEFNWQPLVDIISGSYTNLTLVYKPELHLESISNLVDKMTVQLPDVSISQSMVNLNDIYPDVIDDSSERFILTLGFQVTNLLNISYRNYFSEIANDTGILSKFLESFIAKVSHRQWIEVGKSSFKTRPFIINNSPYKSSTKNTSCHHRQVAII